MMRYDACPTSTEMLSFTMTSFQCAILVAATGQWDPVKPGTRNNGIRNNGIIIAHAQ